MASWKILTNWYDNSQIIIYVNTSCYVAYYYIIFLYYIYMYRFICVYIYRVKGFGKKALL